MKGQYLIFVVTFVILFCNSIFSFTLLPAQGSPSQPQYVQPISVIVTIPNGAGHNHYCAATEDCFLPDSIVITAGNTVTWVNNDSILYHSLIAENANNPIIGHVFGHVDVAPKQTMSYTFTYAGTFNIFCRIHPWLTGVVTVNNA